ncbi:hypothetical protein CONPUDRAFT_81722, partial [Coniophora puteana RWD-64-598 SS2]
MARLGALEGFVAPTLSVIVSMYVCSRSHDTTLDPVSAIPLMSRTCPSACHPRSASERPARTTPAHPPCAPASNLLRPR